MRDHYFAPGIFAVDVRWIARSAPRTGREAGIAPGEHEPAAESIAPVVAGPDDMKSKPKGKRTSGAGKPNARRAPGPSTRRFKRPPVQWEPAVPAVKFRRDGPWELGSGLE